MRLLYMTDTHIRGTTPRSRTDDFLQTMRTKIQEVIEIVNQEKVDYVLHGGDVFDRPNLSPAIVREFASLLRKIQVPIYVIAGNHDIYGHNPSTVGRTMLGLLDAFGTVNLIQSEEVVLLQKKGVTVQLTGQPFHYDLDKRDCSLDYETSHLVEANYRVHMVHGMLVDRALPSGVAHTMLHQIWEGKHPCDILLTGHYHAGFPIQEKAGKYIINPGAMARIDAQRSELKRKPQVALIDINEDIQVRLRPLKSARPSEEIFDRSSIEEAVYREQKWTSFVQQIGAAGNYQGIHVEEIIYEIAQLEGIEERVKKEALRLIAEVEEEGETSH